MNFSCENLHCSDKLIASFVSEINEVQAIISEKKWAPDYSLETKSTILILEGYAEREGKHDIRIIR